MEEAKKNLLTYAGLRKLEDELHDLKVVKRKEVAGKIKEAREQGDLSENADYDAARNEQAEIEAKIKKLETILENVQIIESVSTDEVGVGTTVKIAYIDDEDDIDQYKIVGSQEADPFESKISNESPIAKALMGHKVGDVVSVESPNGSYEVKVIEIN